MIDGELHPDLILPVQHQGHAVTTPNVSSVPHHIVSIVHDADNCIIFSPGKGGNPVHAAARDDEAVGVRLESICNVGDDLVEGYDLVATNWSHVAGAGH